MLRPIGLNILFSQFFCRNATKMCKHVYAYMVVVLFRMFVNRATDVSYL